MTFKSKYITIFLSIIVCLSQYSCLSIKYSSSGASIPVEAKTISVQFFENQAPVVSPSLSFEITNGLKDYIQSNTKLILVNDIGDLNFEGVITGYDETPTAVTGDDLRIAQNRFTITLKVKYTNSFNKEDDWENSFSRFETYSSSMSFEAAEASYTKQIIELLIEDIFNKAFVNW